MSTLEETPAVSEPIEENNPMETTVKSKKPTLRGYRQKLQATQARIKYREKAIKGFRNHLKQGTFLNGSNHYVPSQKWNHPKLKL